MNCSPTRPRTNSAFTLTELMVSLGLVGVATVMGYSVLVSGLQLFTQNSATNMSNFRTRQSLDRIGQIIRYAEEQPELITANGTIVSGSTASSDGVLVKNLMGGPYIFKNASGNGDDVIPASATTFTVEYVPGSACPDPLPGQWFILEITERPELEIASVSGLSDGSYNQGNTTVTLRRKRVTTTQPIGYIAKPGSYRVAGYLYRKEAYVFYSSNNQAALRHYPRVTSGMNYAAAANYRVLASGFQKLNNQPFFARTIVDGLETVWLRYVAHSSGRAEYAETIAQRKTLTTMPMNLKMWNVGR